MLIYDAKKPRNSAADIGLKYWVGGIKILTASSVFEEEILGFVLAGRNDKDAKMLIPPTIDSVF